MVFLPANRAHDGAYTAALQQLGVEVLACAVRRRARRRGCASTARASTWSMVSRHYVAGAIPAAAAQRTRRRRGVVFDTVDLHYLRERRGAELAGDADALRAAAAHARTANWR